MSERLNIAMIFGNVRRPIIIGGKPPIQVTGKVLTFSGWSLVGSFYEYSLYDSKIAANSIVEVVPSRHDIATVQAAQIMPESDVTAGYVKLYSKNAPAADIDITINIHTGLSTTPAKGFFIASGADGADGADGQNGTNGIDGDSAYVYIAYASDDSGTDFTTTFNPALDYIAILATDTEIPSPAVGDFAGLWKSLGGIYSWKIHSSEQGIEFLDNPSSLQISTDGSGAIVEVLTSGYFRVSAINEMGETLASEFDGISLYENSTYLNLSWDTVEGATGYKLYFGAGTCFSVGSEITLVDIFAGPPGEEIMNPEIPKENTAATAFQIPFEIENNNTVDFIGEGIDAETKVDESDATRKEVKLIKQQSDWDEENTESPNFIKGKFNLEEGENISLERYTNNGVNEIKIHAVREGIRTRWGTINLEGSSGLTYQHINIVPEPTRIDWAEFTWVLLDGPGGVEEDKGQFEMFFNFDSNGDPYVIFIKEPEFSSPRILDIEVYFDLLTSPPAIHPIIKFTIQSNSLPFSFLHFTKWDGPISGSQGF